MIKIKGTLFIKQYFMSTCKTEHILLDKNKRISNSLKCSSTIYSKTALYTSLYDLLFSVSTCKFWACEKREQPTYNWCVINIVCPGTSKVKF